MLSAVSTNIVDRIGRGNMFAVNGFPETQGIKPFTVLVETTPRWFYFFSSKQYIAHGFLISHVLNKNGVDAIRQIKTSPSNTIDFGNESTTDFSGKLALAMSREFPNLETKTTGKSTLSMKLNPSKLWLKTVDVGAFEKALDNDGVELLDNAFIESIRGKSRRRLGVVIEVLETAEKAKVEFIRKRSGTAVSSAEVGTLKGSLTGDINSEIMETYQLGSGTVLACRWQVLEIKDNKLRFVHIPSYRKVNPIVKMGDITTNDEDAKKDRDYRFEEFTNAEKENITIMKKALRDVLKSYTDIQALFDVYYDETVKEDTFASQLVYKDSVWKLLHLVGCEHKDENINVKFDGPFKALIPVLVASLSVIKIREDRDAILRVKETQKEELLCIIDKAMDNAKSISYGPNLKEELTQDMDNPVKIILAVIDFKIDYVKEKVLPPPEKTCLLEAMFYLLKYL